MSRDWIELMVAACIWGSILGALALPWAIRDLPLPILERKVVNRTSAITIILLMWLYWATDFAFKITEGGGLSLRIVARGCVLAAWTAFVIVAWRHYRREREAYCRTRTEPIN